MNSPDTHAVEMIPIERITVINPRVRTRRFSRKSYQTLLNWA